MSQVPPNYDRQYSFTGFTVNNPTAQQPGNYLDQEFDAVRASINQTIGRLSEIQRDDGALKMSQAQANALAAASEGVLSSSAQAAVQAAAGGSHTHAISGITGLQAALNLKADETALINGLANKAPSSHTHPISEVLLLQDALDGKASASHTHTISNITGLSSEFKGRLLQMDVLSGTGTYTPPTGAKAIYVEVQGGGGSGAGVIAVSTNITTVSSGGGGGGFCSKFFTGTLASSYAYSVGLGATAPIAGAAGSSGGNSTFDAMTASGGSGGNGATAFGNFWNVAGGAGGAATGGQINIKGQKGGSAMIASGFVTFSNGGSSFMGYGGVAQLNAVADAATGYGAGGGGISAYGYPGAQTAKVGSAGTNGIIRVWVYG